ncbi:hypothetical protein IM538_20930 [Cytobacillus suaedae]|nr:hypothetical protein IM538_20930 [Cytobacillus suaedae]
MKKWVMGIFLIMLLTACSDKVEDVTQETPKQTEEVEKEEASKEIAEETPQPLEIPAFPKATKRTIPVTTGFEDIESFQLDPIVNENKATYDLNLTLDDVDRFTVNAEIKVENHSPDTWNEMIFYLIPNAFIEENKPKHMEGVGELTVEGVEVDGKDTRYLLKHDTLYIPAENGVVPGAERIVNVKYSFVVPEPGIRFSKRNNNYYLAQWYPMLATYSSGWKKEDYNSRGESYHTDFSDFTVTYQLPEEYMVFSSSDEDPKEASTTGVLVKNNIKDFYMAITKDMKVVEGMAGDVEVRAIGLPSSENMDRVLKLSLNAVNYLSEQIAPFPHKQLDLIMDEGGMEYPGIVTVTSAESGHSHVIVHEIAHQWFYGLVSNDPYYDTYIDEGLTNFATYLYFIGFDGRSPEGAFQTAHDNLKMVDGEQQKAGKPLHEYAGFGFMVANYEMPSIKLWELTGSTEAAFAYLKKYAELYSYKEVDSYEWLRFTKAYFKIEDNEVFSDWISLE